ncbi:MAG: hypothetical protein ABIE36_01925 [Candidatus Diapherotrites archaeon]
MGKTLEKVKDELDELFEKAKSSKNIKDILNFKFSINYFLDEGYNIGDYIHKYNKLDNEK